MNDQKNDIRENAIQRLKDIVFDINCGRGEDIYACDLHHELFNTELYIIGTYKAKQFLGAETFDIIQMIKEYEQDNYGRINTDFSCPESVANMFAYIVGEEILSESKHLDEVWNNLLEYDDYLEILDEIDYTTNYSERKKNMSVKTKILFNHWRELSCGNWVMIDGDENGYSPVIAQCEEEIIKGDYSELTAPYDGDYPSDGWKQGQQTVDEINKIFGTSFKEDDFAGR